MKKTSFILLAIAISTVSCVMSQKKNQDKEKIPSLEPPKALDDEWSKWLVGNWQGTAKSDFGPHKDWAKGSCRMNIELTLNDQFLVRRGQAQISGLSDEYIKCLRSLGIF
ncbi:MAG: hypothetical protein ABII09_05335 [Planctomycetota bacterium]